MFRKLFRFTIVIFLVMPGLSARAQQDTPTTTPIHTPTEASTIEPSLSPPTGTGPPQISIESLTTGQALQGVVTIIVIIPVDGFQNAELAFSYKNNPTNTWFLIQSIDEPTTNKIYFEWDTTTITDGTYNLRLTVINEDGNQFVDDITGLRVRNYTPIETNTPTPVTPTTTAVPGSSPTPTETPIPPTVTPLPKNPAQLSTNDISLGFGKGVLATIGIFALIGLYIVVRKVSTPR